MPFHRRTDTLDDPPLADDPSASGAVVCGAASSCRQYVRRPGKNTRCAQNSAVFSPAVAKSSRTAVA